MSGRNEKLAAFATLAAKLASKGTAGQPEFRQLDELSSLRAAIMCARAADAVTNAEFGVLDAIAWSESATDGNFSAFVGDNARRVVNEEELRGLPPGAFVAFIELDPGQTFPLPGGVGLGQRRKLIHAMVSLGNGRFAGTQNQRGIGRGHNDRWEILDLGSDLAFTWSGEDVNAVAAGARVSRLLRIRYRLLDDVRAPLIAADLERLALLRDAAATDSILRLVLNDAIQASGLIKRESDWLTTTKTFYATVFYDTQRGMPTRYSVAYQPGNIGNLVHELTHVQVNEAYHRDFINYAAASPGAALPQRIYDSEGRCTNEADRKTAWQHAASNEHVVDELTAMQKAIERVKFQPAAANPGFADQKTKVLNQLLYGMVSAGWEHHTVLNQILVWMHIDWDLARRPETKAFMDMLEDACTRARDSREKARGVHAGP
jgi:hypothetical protein